MPEAIIETAIGLFLVFTVMSLVASQIVEWLASLSHWRADNLEKAIRSMLSDPDVKAKLDQGALVLANQLYEHPLIASLAQPGSKPSYIPASKFALALFDVVTTAGTEASTIGRARLGLEQVKNQLLAQLSSEALAELQGLIDQIQKLIDAAEAARQTAETIAALPLPPELNNSLNEFLKRNNISPSAFNTLVQSVNVDSDLVFAQILGGAARLSQLRPELAQIVTNLFSGIDMYLAKEEPRLAAARRNVEQWFNDAMDRSAGWYKRHTQLWLGLIGFLFALALNVDSVTIATTLWRDPTLRQNVVEQAQKFELPAGSTGQPMSSSETAQVIRDLNTDLSQDLRLPIGWRIEIHHLQAAEVCTLLPQKPGDVGGILYGADCFQLLEAVPNPTAGVFGKLVGFLITAVAVTQGAPFWFNLLQSSLRLAGKKPEDGKPAGK